MSQAGAGTPPAPITERPGRPLSHEEPEFNAERDLPTEDTPEAADDESVAGEEDPGAALDTARPRKGQAGG